MRGDNGLRGESERVAERVRALLAADARTTGAGVDDDVHDFHEFRGVHIDDPSDDHETGYADDSTDDVTDDRADGYSGGARDRTDGRGAGGDERVSPWRRLAAAVPVRLDPGRRAAMATGLAALLAAALAAVWLMSSRPTAVPVAQRGGGPASPLAASASTLVGSPLSDPAASAGAVSSAPAGDVVVDVAGRVRRPGLYHLPIGSRVDDAISAAGGALRGVDLSSLNLASKVIDGQQIAVGKPGAAGAQPVGGAGGSSVGAGGAGGAAGSSGAPVNLNTASLDQLQTLPGIGPALGQRILDYRTQHGSFGSVDQLDDVAGIGTVTFARLKPLVTV